MLESINWFCFIIWKVNGRNLLSVDYDRTLRTEKVYDDHRKFLLKIEYDTSGHPTLWVPSSKLMSVNLTYSSTGQVTSIQRGPTIERVEYDSQGRIVSRTLADGKTWSYTYLDKVRLIFTIVCWPSYTRRDAEVSFQTFHCCRTKAYMSKTAIIIESALQIINFSGLYLYYKDLQLQWGRKFPLNYVGGLWTRGSWEYKGGKGSSVDIFVRVMA